MNENIETTKKISNSKINRQFLFLLPVGTILASSMHFMNHAFAYSLGTLLWLMIFLYVVQSATLKKELILSWLFFALGFNVRFWGFTGVPQIDLLLLSAIATTIYGIFYLYRRICMRKDSFMATLSLPILWSLLYGFYTLIRIPSALRIDMLFFDHTMWMQAESLLTSYGMNFLIVWMVSLLVYAFNKKCVRIYLGCGVFVCMVFLYGYCELSKAKEPDFYVKMAYTTGPYVGDFIDFKSVSYEDSINSLQNSVVKAKEEKVSLLVFNEESFDVEMDKKSSFLQYVSGLAKENQMHILIGMDFFDSQDSQEKNINEIVWVDNQGKILGEYVKRQIIPIVEADYVRGQKKVDTYSVVIDGNEINISFAICYDSNFPYYIKKIAKETEVLFLPSWDWQAITKLHYRICGSLSVENRLTMIKPTYDGYTIATDAYGRVVALKSTEETGYENIQIIELPVWKK